MGTNTKPTILILGANGMLGHKLYQVLSKDFDVYGSVRDGANNIRHYGIFKYVEDKLDCIDKFEKLIALVDDISPHVIVNCIGIVDKTRSAFDMLQVNALFPLQLQLLCVNTGTKLIHISTDCVFSGREGNYTEGWPADATDVYGKTKYLGEVTGDNALTIRTSIIGRELVRSRGLLEWFISQQGKTVEGYSNAIFSGFPTVTFANIIKDYILKHPTLNGLHHIASVPISKYDLLVKINQALQLSINIIKEPSFYCDRSLNGDKFRVATGFRPFTWNTMINELAEDVKQYSAWR